MLARPRGTWTDPETVASLERTACWTKSLAEHLASRFLQFTPSPPQACLVDVTSSSQKIASFPGRKRYGRKTDNQSFQNALQRVMMFTAEREHLDLTQVGVPKNLRWSAKPQGLLNDKASI